MECLQLHVLLCSRRGRFLNLSLPKKMNFVQKSKVNESKSLRKLNIWFHVNRTKNNTEKRHLTSSNWAAIVCTWEERNLFFHKTWRLEHPKHAINNSCNRSLLAYTKTFRVRVIGENHPPDHKINPLNKKNGCRKQQSEIKAFNLKSGLSSEIFKNS